MKVFKDNKARDWELELNVRAVKRVRDLVGIDLLEIGEGKLLERLYRDPVLLVDALYAICRPQAEVKEISDEDFGRAMAGDAIGLATTALLDELVLFSPSPRDRAILGRILEESRIAMDKARSLAEAKLADGSIQRAVDRFLDSLGTSSGSPPASSELTPDLSHSGSSS